MEVIVAGILVLILLAIAIPAILAMRERSRRVTCQSRMAALTSALLAYQERYDALPYAAKWSTFELQSLALHESKRWDLFIGENWAVTLLGDLNRSDLATQYDSTSPLSSLKNDTVRRTRVSEFVCPADEFNIEANAFLYSPTKNSEIEFARGNFAINGGTNSIHTMAGSTSTPTGDHANLKIDAANRTFTYGSSAQSVGKNRHSMACPGLM